MRLSTEDIGPSDSAPEEPEETISENQAEQEILRLLRRKPVGMGMPVMRISRDGECLILDVNQNPSPILFRSDRWSEILPHVVAYVGMHGTVK
jgi:hypothetical protein